MRNKGLVAAMEEELVVNEPQVPDSELDNQILQTENDNLEDDNVEEQFRENDQIGDTLEGIQDGLVESKEKGEELSDAGLNVLEKSLEHFNIRRGYPKTKNLGFESIKDKPNLDIAIETVGGYLKSTSATRDSASLWMVEAIIKYFVNNEKTRKLLQTSIEQAASNFKAGEPKDLSSVLFGSSIIKSNQGTHTGADVIANLKHFSGVFNNHANVAGINQIAADVEELTKLIRKSTFIGNKDDIKEIENIVAKNNAVMSALNTDISINGSLKVTIKNNSDEELTIDIKTTKPSGRNSFKALSEKEVKDLEKVALELTSDTELTKAIENLVSKIKTHYGFTSGKIFTRLAGPYAKDIRIAMKGILNVTNLRWYYTSLLGERNKIVNDAVKYIKQSSN